MRRLFKCDLKIFVILCEEKENVKKMQFSEMKMQFSEMNISRNAKAISFNFISIYVRQKRYKLGRNQLSSFGDMEG